MSDDLMHDASYIERNQQQLERMRALVDRLGDDELRRPVGEHWTVAATLAHLAYWDIRAVGALEATLQHGLPIIFWDVTDGLPVNDALTPKWLALPPREAADGAVAAATALAGVVERLPDDLRPAVARKRYRILERAIHWSEHLDEIERALAMQAPPGPSS
jgi:hypothetical protein